MDYQKEIANRFKELRNARKLTIEELAYRGGVSVSFINQILNAKRFPSLTMLIKFTDKVFNISLTDFFNFNSKNSIEKDKHIKELSYLISDLTEKDKDMVINMIRVFAKRLKK